MEYGWLTLVVSHPRDNEKSRGWGTGICVWARSLFRCFHESDLFFRRWSMSCCALPPSRQQKVAKMGHGRFVSGRSLFTGAWLGVNNFREALEDAGPGAGAVEERPQRLIAFA